MGTQTNVQYSEDPGIQVPMFHQNGVILNNNLDRLLVFAVWCHTPRATPSTAFLNVDKGEFKSSLMSLEHRILFLTLSEKKNPSWFSSFREIKETEEWFSNVCS